MAAKERTVFIDRARALLDELYPGRGAEIAPRLLELASKWSSKRGGVGTEKDGGKDASRLSSKDAILISYPDMLEGTEGSPLSRLADFAESRLAGEFSHIHILPFFPSSSDEGFSVMDHRAVDPRLGDWGEIERIGSRFGLAVDLVLNHASARGLWFRRFLEGMSPYDRYFITRPRGYDASAVFRPRTHPLLTHFRRDDGGEVEVWTTFSADQVDLDFAEPEVLLEMVDVVLGYAARGARILRLDAVAYAWKIDRTNCVDLPEVHALVRLFRLILDELAPGVALLTETNLPHAVNISYFGSEEGGGPEASLVYNFSLPPLVLHAFVKGEAGHLAAWASRLPEPSPDRAFVNFLSSHDGIGVTPARDLLPEGSIDLLARAVVERGGLVSLRSTPQGPIPYELNTTFLDALVPAEADDERRASASLAAHALMFSLAGVPAVYFHSLVGSRNWPEGPRLTGSNRSIHRERPEAGRLEAELDDETSLRAEVFRGMSSLLAARAARGAFDPGSPQVILAPDGSGRVVEGEGGEEPRLGPLFAIVRGGADGAVLAAVNVSNQVARCAIPEGFRPSGLPFDPTGGSGSSRASGDGDRPDSGGFAIPPLSCLWLDGRFGGF